MVIYNNRNRKDFANLSSQNWSGILVGTDGYPTENYYGSGYYIAGGNKTWYFKARAIEFYGVKTQT